LGRPRSSRDPHGGHLVFVARCQCATEGDENPLLELILDLTTLKKIGDFPELPVSVLNDVKGLHLIVLYVVVGKERFP
jgi:hypothetical protein